MRIQVDTNLLLRVRDADDPRHAVCVEALDRLLDGTHELFLCAQVLIEYWVVATRPRNVNGLGLSAAEADLDFQEFCRTFVVLPEPPDMAVRWHDLVSRCAVHGRNAHDTRLIALMLAHGVTTVLTLNSADFARYTEITCLAPEDV
jgi:predicted nucleic acid-binding protein